MTSPTTNRTLVAIYARISQDRDGTALGIQRQLTDCRTEAGRLGWTVAEEYADDDISAYSGKRRPADQRMLDDIADGHRDSPPVQSPLASPIVKGPLRRFAPLTTPPAHYIGTYGETTPPAHYIGTYGEAAHQWSSGSARASWRRSSTGEGRRTKPRVVLLIQVKYRRPSRQDHHAR